MAVRFPPNEKSHQFKLMALFSSGDWTRTSDLRVMSPTSYLLLYPAMWTANIQPFLHLFQTKINIPLPLAPIPPKIHKFGLFTLWTQSTILYPLFCPIPSGPCSSCLLGAGYFWLFIPNLCPFAILVMPLQWFQESMMIKMQKET